MPADKKTELVDQVEETFRKRMLETYDLEDAFVNDICSMVRDAVESLATTASAAPKSRARNTQSKAKKQRKKSAYNVYVREMMKTEDIQKLNHKEKMGAIAALWKQLDGEAKSPYTDMANVENAENTPAEETA